MSNIIDSPLRLRIGSCLVVAVAAIGSRPAYAASLASCTVSVTAVSFGLYNPLSAVNNNTTGVVTTNCSLLSGTSLLVAYTISLGPGNGTYAQRQLQSGASKLTYNIFSNSAMTTVWRDGSGGSSAVSDSYLLGVSGSTRAYTAYAKLLAGQTLAGRRQLYRHRNRDNSVLMYVAQMTRPTINAAMTLVDCPNCGKSIAVPYFRIRILRAASCNCGILLVIDDDTPSHVMRTLIVRAGLMNAAND